MTIKLDDIDISILDNLQRNGRMTNVELANRAGISAPPSLRRLKNLENSGVITSYHARINSTIIGYTFSAFCFIALARQSERHAKEFINYINGLSKIRNCYETTGDFDYILKVIAKDFVDYENFLTKSIKTFENIQQIKTYVVMKTNKHEEGVPLLD